MASAASTSSTRAYREAAPHHGRQRIRARTLLLHGIIWLFCLAVLLPIAWVLLLSVKSMQDAYTGQLWPRQFDFTHYEYVVRNLPNAVRNFGNSIIVTTATVIITSIVAILAGYAVVHLRLPGRGLVVTVLVASLFFPTRIVSLIGIFQIQNSLGLINTLPGLILPYITLNLALSVLIMRGIFEQISAELVDAARIDGASSWRTLTQILMPLTVNGVIVLIIVNFVTAWGEYLLAVTLTNDQSMRTLPVVLATAFGGAGEWEMPRIAAIYVMAIVPGILGFAFAQRWYMKGLMEGALKV
jgi:ABC-type glycerol-3-phosphate transport system permease component